MESSSAPLVVPVAGINLEPGVIISCVTVSLILTLVAVLGFRKVERVPRGTQALFEHIYQWLDGLNVSLMGPLGKRYTPFCMAIFLYILVSNWVGLIPNVFEWLEPIIPQAHVFVPLLEPATTSVDITMAMAIISFIAFIGLGLMRSFEKAEAGHGHSHDHGHDHAHDHEHSHDHVHGPVEGAGFMGWLGHYIQPIPSLSKSMEGAMKTFLIPLLLILFVFLNIVEEVARLLSLTFRLFGNIFGEHTVKVQLLSLIGLFSGQATSADTGLLGGHIIPFLGFGAMSLIIWAILLFVICLGTLAGFIQAFVFTLLTMSYIAHAVADHH